MPAMPGRLTAAVALAAALATEAAAAGASAPPPPTPASVVFADQLLLRSERIGQTFLIQVGRPVEAAPSSTKAPVIYALDGILTFGLLTSANRAMPGEGLTPQAYVVAVSYPPEQTIDTPTLRMRDLLHHRVKHQRTGQMVGGGGAAFEDFLLNELKPLIERRYAVDPARSTLMGHSLGGLFAAQVLADHPETFAGYIIGSPAMHYDADLAGRVRAAAARGGGRRVFIGVGALEPEMVARADQLEQALAGPGFKVARRTFPGETHTSVLGALTSAGLRFVLGTPAAAAAVEDVR